MQKITIVIAILLLAIILPSSALEDGARDTRITTLTSPVSPTDGDTVTITNYVEWDDAGSWVPVWESIGRMDHIHVHDPITIGNPFTEDILTLDHSTNYTLTFTPTKTYSNILMMELPMVGVSTDSSSFLSGTMILVTVTDIAERLRFEIAGDELIDMVSTQNDLLLILESSFEVHNAGAFTFVQDTEYTIGIQFISFPTGSTFDIRTGSGIDISSSSVLAQVPLGLFSGEYLGTTIPDAQGVTTTSITATGTSYYIGVYADAIELFDRTYIIKRIQTVTTSPFVTVTNRSIQFGNQLVLEAYVRDGAGGSLLPNVDVSFYLEDGLESYIGTSTTDLQGRASLIISTSPQPGTYAVRAEATFSGSTGYDTGSITISKVSGVFTNLFAEATYSDIFTGVSIVTITGNLLAGANPVVGETVYLWETVELDTQQTAADGSFSFTQTTLNDPGIYSDVYTLKIQSDFYDVSDTTLDLTIYAGEVIIQVSDITEEYIGQPITINGTTRDIHSTNLDLSGEVRWFDASGGIWRFDTLFTTTNGYFSVTSTTNLNVGSYTFQITTYATSTHASKQQEFTVSIGTSEVIITRGARDGEITPLVVTHNEVADFSVELYDINGDPVVGETVDFYLNTYLGSATSDVNGLVSFTQVITQDMIDISTLTVRVYFIDSNYEYTPTSFAFYVNWVPGTLTATIVSSNNIYDSTGEITATFTDSFGNPIDDDQEIDVVVGGQSYIVTTTGGIATVSHTYTDVGDIAISASYLGATQDFIPLYQDMTKSVTITVSRGYYTITVDDALTMQGDDVALHAIILDHTGGYPDTSTTVFFEVHNGVSWQSLGTATPNATGHVDLQATNFLSVGFYPIRARTDTSLYYTASEGTAQLTVSSALTEIVIFAPSSYDYGALVNNRAVNLLLRVPIVGFPIEGMPIDVSFGSFSWNLITDVNGEVSLTLPEFITPGTYTLQVDADTINTEYIASSASQDITVVGAETILQITSLDTNVWYGETFNFDVVATDIYGNTLAGHQVNLIIGSFQAVFFTDANGRVTDSVTLRTSTGVVASEFHLQPTGGYNGQTTVQQINVTKRAQIIELDPFTGQVMYDVDLDLYMKLYLETVGTNPTSLIEMLVWNGSDYVFLTSFSSTSEETDIFSMTLPILDAGQVHKIRIIATHDDYLNATIDVDVTVIPADMVVLTTANTVDFTEDTRIEFIVTDQRGDPMVSKEVQLFFTIPGDPSPTISLVAYTDTDGIAEMFPVFPIAGDLIVDYYVQDGGNYNVYGPATLQITVNYINAVISYDFSVSSSMNLVSHVSDGVQSYVAVPMNIYYFDGNEYILVTEIHSEIPYIITSIGKYRLEVRPGGFLADTLDLEVFEEELQVVFGSDEKLRCEYGVPSILDITLTGNGSMMGITLHAQVYVNSMWQDLGSLSFDEFGDMVTLFTMGEIPGSYSFHVTWDAQLLYKQGSHVGTLVVEKANLNLSFGDLSAYSNSPSVLTFTVVDSTGNPWSGKQAQLLIDDQSYGSTVTDSNGNLIFTVTVDLPVGSYGVEIVIVGDTYIEGFSDTATIKIWLEADISVQVGEIVYGDGGYIIVTVTDSLTGNPSSGISIELYENSIFADNFLVSGTTDVHGEVSFFIYSLDEGRHTLIITTSDAELYGDTVTEIDVQVIPDSISITYVISEFGISVGKEITFLVSDESSAILQGRLYYWIYDSSDSIAIQGDMEVNDDMVLILPGDLIGDYYLKITYHDNKNQYYLEQELIIPDMGYDPISDLDISLVDEQVVHKEETEIRIMVSYEGNAVAGLQVQIAINNTMIDEVTDGTGILTILVDNLYPGSYPVILTFSHDVYLTNTIQADMILDILRGFEPFGVEMNTQVIANTDLNITISDHVSETGHHGFTAVILKDDTIIKDIGNFSGGLISTSGLLPGEYILQITRYHDYYADTQVEVLFSIVGLHADISITNKIQDTGILFTFSAQSDGSLVVNPVFTVIIKTNGGEFVFDNCNGTLFFANYLEGTLVVKAELTGLYIGTEEKTIPLQGIDFDVTTSDNHTVDPNNQAKPHADDGWATILVGVVGASSVFKPVTNLVRAKLKKPLTT